jgi:hypothetical protein
MEKLLSAITTSRLELVAARADLADLVVDFYEQ